MKMWQTMSEESIVEMGKENRMKRLEAFYLWVGLRIWIWRKILWERTEKEMKSSET